MGFTPLEGLAMATRSGSVDPGLVLWLMEHTDLTEERISRALEHESGMLALAGTDDMRTVIERSGLGDADVSFLGVGIASDRNQAAAGDCELTAPGAGVRSLLVRAREDLEIARQVPEALARASAATDAR